jgi:transcriptional regulator with XRE-family HTH domain
MSLIQQQTPNDLEQNMYIGERLKKLRKEKSLSLTALAKKSGVQLASLSRIENKKMTGTLDSHMKIAMALGVPLTDLYMGLTREEPKVDYQTPSTISELFVHSDKAASEILTTQVLSKKMMPVLIKLEPQGQTAREESPPETEKFLFVLEGELTARISEKTFVLQKHNSLYFDAALPHRFTNTGKKRVTALCIAVPVAL